MIISVGTDICKMNRIGDALEKFGARFLGRVYGQEELKRLDRVRADNHKGKLSVLARRFAAKEACAKALGTGMRKGVFWRDMQVINLPSGQPTMKLTNGALKRLQEITPTGMTPYIHVSLTDDEPLAMATIIIEARQG